MCNYHKQTWLSFTTQVFPTRGLLSDSVEPPRPIICFVIGHISPKAPKELSPVAGLDSFQWGELSPKT